MPQSLKKVGCPQVTVPVVKLGFPALKQVASHALQTDALIPVADRGLRSLSYSYNKNDPSC